MIKYFVCEKEYLAKAKLVPNQPFNVSEKKIECENINHNHQDISYKRNSAVIMHLLRHRLGPTTGKDVLEFETTLRNPQKNEDLLKKEKSWNSLPFKQKK